MQRRPVIGISCYVERVDRAPWIQQWSAVLPYDYVHHVESVGGAAVILPPRLDGDDRLARDVLSRIDGLIIAGGADIEARRYGAAAHPTAQAPRADRDAWELALARVAHAVDVPILGICRGMQVMAVAAGATLIQHLPDVVGTDEHCVAPGQFADHSVAPIEGTLLAGILGDGTLEVPTYHHQSVDPESLTQTGFLASAWHADGTLEAMEDPGAVFRLAVQWHPEAGEDSRLFAALVAAAREGTKPSS